MLPLLAAAGRMLVTGAVRGAAAGAARGAAAGAGRGIIKDVVKDKVEDEIKGKIVKVSTDKFLAKKSTATNPQSIKSDSKGGALVKSESSSIVKKESDNPLLDELITIKTTLITIKSLLDKSNSFDKGEYSRRKKELEKQKRKSKEDLLEKKPEKKKIGKSAVKPSGNLFDFIKNYLLNIFLGSLATFAFDNLPKIIDVIGGIASGFDNLWKVLKFGIISLTTNFPKQIKFLAKISAKLFGGPIKLVGKLFLKAGSLLTNLLKKAGGFIFNLVGGPLKSTAKKILGESGTQVAKKVLQSASNTSNAATKAVKSGVKKAADLASSPGAKKLIGRLKTFSKIFKRVPVIGSILGIGIDLALGEPLDRAVVGAMGAALGGAIGGAIGTGIIPIPGVGTFLGGVIGAGIGDWAAKQFYKYLTGRVKQAEKESNKGSKGSDPFTAGRGGLSEKEFDKKYGVQLTSKGGLTKGPLTRGTGVQKRTFESKESRNLILSRKRPFEISQKAIKNSEQFFGKDQSKYLFNLTQGFKKANFIGDLLRIGIALAMGETILKSTTDGAADNMSYEMLDAYKNGLMDIEEDVDTKSITYAFKKWARNKIYAEVVASKKYQTEIKSRPGTSSPGAGGGSGEDSGSDGPTGPSPVIQGGSADFWTLAAVASLEGITPQGEADVAQAIYNRVASGVFSVKTIKDAILSPGQFQPVTGDGADLNKWRAIKDRESAIAAVATHKGKGVATATKYVDEGARSITNAQLQKNAAEWVGGRTDFAVPSAANKYPGGFGYKTRHGHLFGWYVGPGAISYGRKNPGPAKVPSFGNINVPSSGSTPSSNLAQTQSTSSSPPQASSPAAEESSQSLDFTRFATILGDKKGKILGPESSTEDFNPNAPFVSVPVKPPASPPPKAQPASISSSAPKAQVDSISQSASYDKQKSTTIILPPAQQSATPPMGGTALSRIDFDSSMLNSDSSNMLKQIYSAALF